MATGYIFTKTGNSSTKVVHVTNDVVDLGRTKIFKGPVLIEDNDPSLISIKEGGGNAMSLNISAIITIDGSAPAGTMQGVIDQLDAVFPDASTTGGSGGGAYTELTTSTYTGGNKFKNISGSGASTITVDATTGGALMIFNSGSATTINFTNTASGTQSYTINASGTNGGITGFGIFVVNDEYVITPDVNVKGLAIPVPDVTAPTLVSTVAISAHVIRRTFIENVASSVYTGSTFTIGGVVATITGQAVSGTHIDYTLSNTMTGASVVTDAYNATTGDITDTSGNPLATYSAVSVTNSISGVEDLVFVTNSGTLTNTSNVYTSGGGANSEAWAHANKKIASGSDGLVYVQYKADAVNAVLHLNTSAHSGATTEAGCDAGVSFFGGVMYVWNGATPTASGTSPVADSFYGVRRTGSTFEIVTSVTEDPVIANWTAVGSPLAQNFTGDAIPVIEIINSSPTVGKMYYPKGIGVS